MDEEKATEIANRLHRILWNNEEYSSKYREILRKSAKPETFTSLKKLDKDTTTAQKLRAIRDTLKEMIVE
jgi:hypothetical protein